MEGVERCFLIRIGRYNGAEKISYEDIRQAQEALAQKVPEVVMVSRKFAEMKARGLMKDEFHYYQQAYNEVGIQAGENTRNISGWNQACERSSLVLPSTAGWLN